MLPLPATKLNALTGLRFAAAAAIVLHHVKDHGFPTDFVGAWLMNNGVAFFFILSGFILTYVYPSLPTQHDVRRFWVARVARLWPGHIAALVLAYLLLDGAPSSFGTGEDSLMLGLANIFLVHAWVPFHQFFFSYNAVSWSISVEMFFYLAFPFLIRAVVKNWWRALTLSAALVVVLIVICASATLPVFSGASSGLTLNGIICFSPLARLFEFVLGMCTALAWQALRTDIRVRQLSRDHATVAELSVIGLVFALGSIAQPFGRWVEVNLGPAAAQWFNQGGTLSLVFAAVIFVFAFQRGAVSAVLGSRLGIFLGEISFMVYMTHQVILRGALAHTELFATLNGYEKFALYCGVVLAVSTLMWKFIEVPGRRALLRWFDDRAVVPVPAPPVFAQVTGAPTFRLPRPAHNNAR